jgi:hypothetical protein
MKRLLFAVLTAACCVTFSTVSDGVHAQSRDAGPLDTPSGKLEFTHVDREFVATLDNVAFDHFDARALAHFDDVGESDDTVQRMLVDTDAGPVLYEFGARPPHVVRVGQRMALRRVFWQRDEVVMQGSQGWFRFKGGVLTKLQSTTTTYH